MKFVLMPSGQVVTMACMLGQTLQELKIQFANELKMPMNLILLMFDGEFICEGLSLHTPHLFILDECLCRLLVGEGF